MRSIQLLSLVVGLSIIGWSAPGFAAETATRPSLSGHWKLDPEASDDPRDKMREVRLSRPAGGGGGGRGGGRGGIGRDRGGFLGGGDDAGGRGAGGRAQSGRGPGVMRNPEELAIAVGEADITIGLGKNDAQAGTFVTDGEPRMVMDRRGVEREVKAGWDGQKLIVESETARGQLMEVYELAPDGAVLTVNVRLTSPRGRVNLLRVYRRAPAEATPAETATDDADE